MRSLEIVLTLEGERIPHKILSLENLSDEYAKQLKERLYQIAKSYTTTGRPILP